MDDLFSVSLRDTSFQVLRGLKGSKSQRFHAVEKRDGIFTDFGARGQRGEKYLLANQTPQGKTSLLRTGIAQGAKVPAGIREEFYGGITQSQKIDKTLNADFGAETVVSKRPKGFLFVIRRLNIPAQAVNGQREKISVRVGEQSRFLVGKGEVKA